MTSLKYSCYKSTLYYKYNFSKTGEHYKNIFMNRYDLKFVLHNDIVLKSNSVTQSDSSPFFESLMIWTVRMPGTHLTQEPLSR